MIYFSCIMWHAFPYFNIWRRCMPFTSQKAKLEFIEEVQKDLERISHSRTEPIQRIERAQILLAYSDGATLSDITRRFATSYPRVDRCINKALQMGALLSLKDLPGRGRPSSGLRHRRRRWPSSRRPGRAPAGSLPRDRSTRAPAVRAQ